jgi:hypothetical protein
MERSNEWTQFVEAINWHKFTKIIAQNNNKRKGEKGEGERVIPRKRPQG